MAKLTQEQVLKQFKEFMGIDMIILNLFIMEVILKVLLSVKNIKNLNKLLLFIKEEAVVLNVLFIRIVKRK